MKEYIRELMKEARECNDNPTYKKIVENTAIILANCEKALE